MTPSILTFKALKYIVNAESIDMIEINSIISKEFINYNNVDEQLFLESKKTLRKLSYVVYSYVRELGENSVKHFANAIGNICCAVNEHKDNLDREWICSICENYCDYVRSFR